MSQTWVLIILGTVALLSLAASIAIWVYLWRTRRTNRTGDGRA